MDQELPQNSTRPNFKKVILFAGLALLSITASVVAYRLFVNRPEPKIVEEEKPPLPKQGATFILEANPLEASLGSKIKVSVLVKSDLDAANLFIARLKFPSNLLQAKSIDLQSESSSSGFIKNWFISNWVENTIDNNTGSVSLVGGVPNPGFRTELQSTGSAMADVIFEPIAPGEAKITFDDTSAIYRNIDNINILVAKRDLIVKVLGEKPVASISAVPTIFQPAPIPFNPEASPTGTLAGDTGDIDRDGKVNLKDLSLFLSLWNESGFEFPEADLNKDMSINVFDFSKLVKTLKDSKLVQ